MTRLYSSAGSSGGSSPSSVGGGGGQKVQLRSMRSFLTGAGSAARPADASSSDWS